MSLSREVYESAIQPHIRVTILILSALSIGALQPTVARAQQAVNITNAPPRCLDADLGTINQNGTKVQLWDCWGGDNQKWQAVTTGGGIFRIKNVQSGRCLDADLGTINQNGTKVQLWDCWGGDNQNWAWDTAVLPGNTAASGMFNQGSTIAGSACRPVLDADLGTLAHNGTKIQLWECTAGYNQYWINPLPH